MSQDPTKGMPGEPGHDAEGPTGGAGGMGGTGGAGEQTGGTGGMGGPGGSAIGKKRGDVERQLNLLIFSVILLFVVLGVLAGAGWVYLNRQVDRNARAATALCAQRHDLDLRINYTETLLGKHRHQRFIFAIPRTVITQGLARDKNTRVNLDILECKESQ